MKNVSWLPLWLSNLFPETGFLTELRAQLDWDPPFFLNAPSQCPPPHTFYKDLETVNSGPHVHAAGTTPLSAEPSPQPCVVNLKFGRHTLKRLSFHSARSPSGAWAAPWSLLQPCPACHGSTLACSAHTLSCLCSFLSEACLDRYLDLSPAPSPHESLCLVSASCPPPPKLLLSPVMHVACTSGPQSVCWLSGG